ncbi:MAG: hypothetical protein H6672_08725 [Anaerolineaceae bacterium]|nr:hypothetical protein [Anaerolineaceae bacterium]
MEAFQHIGIWWLPNDPDNTVPGTLKFDPLEDARLELTGTFETKSTQRVGSVEIIQGVTADAKKITLYKCTGPFTRHVWRDITFDSSWYDVMCVFEGHHFTSGVDIIFDTLSVSYSNLEEWIGNSGFTINEDKSPEEYTACFRRPPTFEAELDHCRITVWHRFGFHKDIREITFSQDVVITAKVSKAVHFHELMTDTFHPIQNFISLGVGRAVYPLTVDGMIPESKQTIRVFFPVTRPVKISPVDHPRLMLFTFEDISNDFEKYLKTWFAKSTVLKEVTELYFSVLFEPLMYMQVQFLLLVQALEAYHRLVHNGEYLSHSDFKMVKKILLDAIPNISNSEFVESLRSRIAFANEYSLKTRLRLILDEVLEPCAEQVNLLIDNRDIFVKTLRDTRNHLTHHVNKGKCVITDIQQMYSYVQKTKWILQICFLVELGFPSEEISELVARNWLFIKMTSRL